MEVPLAQLVPQASNDVSVKALCLDSRHVQPGSVFFAVPGGVRDGRLHIAEAISKGASAVVYEADQAPALPPAAVPLVPVKGLGAQLSAIAGRFYGEPSAALTLIGVTGTNGKTSVTQLIAQACERLKQRCGIVGTLGTGFWGALEAGRHTTPDPFAVQAGLAMLKDQGAQAVAMEVSSHGLEQGRVAAVQFDIAVFTNLSRDHLDYHGTMEAYAAAKAKLFQWSSLRARVINIDDSQGRHLAEAKHTSQLITFSLENPAATVCCKQISFSDAGIQADLVTPYGEARLVSSLIGRFNLSNLIAVVGALLGMGFTLSDIQGVMPALQGPIGRMQRLGGGAQPLVVVDYAHTPDALEQVLNALRPHTKGRLVCVFGCGGDRDGGKRPLMARIAERLADVVIVTDDNPRTESSSRIIDDIRAGFNEPARATFIAARDEAIAYAIEMAACNDVVLIAGKGHEDYQEINGIRMPFSDLEQAARGLVARGDSNA
ncbi:UDP-N-acetylmuramoyl-L-alanyl-D-glutamate--2,6-diaminopimelate ligase [Pseudomonas asuensis]|uniref:UDP-N-acetylmuramoyl-L-alanyl-D-glutamate--2,6-diaminopimelate ligase n=1 Tax=Pseudomonas asuensis TaxID=1825787 RepID=A0ABQ2GNX2_9PSED|nr:UDP-N-acetylmuramoyl-L-alanyl-D-glutamate--2,6-diaminopimelate ligase [Pseudomonas asuensis]GGM04663.1 UDP-N-acetylmuramoyl-L-alanyl-D-glutamate--2,6-diaminopimelate ligase [Pseudomonas asuensis]